MAEIQRSQMVRVLFQCGQVESSKNDSQDFLTLVATLDYGVNGIVTPL